MTREGLSHVLVISHQHCYEGTTRVDRYTTQCTILEVQIPDRRFSESHQRAPQSTSTVHQHSLDNSNIEQIFSVLQ